MISIITTLTLLATTIYYGLETSELVCLVIIGFSISLGINWFFRATNRKRDIQVPHFKSDDFETVETFDLRPVFNGEAKYLYFAREEENEQGITNLVFNCNTKDGPFMDRHIPSNIVTFVEDNNCEPFVRLAVAHKLVWGDIWQSIIPYRFYSIKYELHIPLNWN